MRSVSVIYETIQASGAMKMTLMKRGRYVLRNQQIVLGDLYAVFELKVRSDNARHAIKIPYFN
jgi:hypothetical protein